MSEKQQIRAIKGMRDITPPASAAWNRVEAASREVFSTFGYGEIRLPILERTELFARSVGLDTDIVTKEMYEFPKKLEILRRATTDQVGAVDSRSEVLKFGQALAVLVLNLGNAVEQKEIPTTEQNQDAIRRLRALSIETIQLWNSGEQQPSNKWTDYFNNARELIAILFNETEESYSLRPEATASVCRAYIEHGMQTLPGNVKLYYIGPMFRRERPQKGRYRQFYQIGAEVLGQSDAPGIDAELIEMLLAFFAKTGLEGAALAVNSIGCKNCRPKYVEILREELRKVKDQLGADSQRRIETNPLRVLDSKIPGEQPIIENLPRISDHLCEDCRTHFAELERQLALRNISYERNWRLVRGLDYYTRTTFEITAPGLGSQNAVCGGGRYDGLVELLGGPPTKGIGFAIGTDRLMMSLEAQGKLKTEPAIDVFIVSMGAAAEKVATQLARRLRDAGVKVELPATEMKLGKALGLGDKLGARYGLIIGDNEVASQRFTLKRLADAQQQSVSEQELLNELQSKL